MFPNTRLAREAMFVNNVLVRCEPSRGAHLINFKEKCWKHVTEADTMTPFI